MEMKTIELSKGKEAIVDDNMFDLLSQYSWHITSKGYARHDYIENGKRHSVYMHRLILNAKNGEFIDHINRNKIDNRVNNLRLCSPSQNAANRKVKSNSKSGYKGVSLVKGKYWIAYIGHNSKYIYLGSFKTKEDAAIAYNDAAFKLHGSYAHPNTLTKEPESDKI